MRELDEIDMEILPLLIDNARRLYSSIADIVDLSAPTVFDCIDRLEDEGITRQFTVDVDRLKLEEGIPVLVDLSIESTAIESVSADLEATRVGDETALQQIVQTVKEAQSRQSEIQNVADRISAYFVPAVIINALFWGTVGYLFPDALAGFVNDLPLVPVTRSSFS